MIRKATIKDLNKIMSCRKAAINNVEPQFYKTEVIKAWFNATTKDLLKKHLEETQVYVYENQSEILGFIKFVVKNKDKCGGVIELYVLPKKQSNGIGKQLLKYAEDYLKKENCNEMYLRSSLNAYNFYLKYNYIFLEDTFMEVNSVKVPCKKMVKKLS